MSESGGFGDGGGFSGGGSDWGGGAGGDSTTQDNSGFFGGGSAPFSGGASDVGPSEGGTFGDSFFRHHQHQEASALPAVEAGVAGFLLGRTTAQWPRPGWGWGGYNPPGWGYSPAQPAYVVAQRQVLPSVYAPIVPGTTVQYSTGVPLPTILHRPAGDNDPRRKARRLFKFAMAAACIAAWWLYFIASGSHTIELRDREQHLLSANSWFVSEIRVEPEGQWPRRQMVAFATTLYTFASCPRANQAEQFELGKAGVVVPRYGFQAWPVWLNTNSVVQLRYTLPRGVMARAVVVLGRDSMQKWEEDPRDEDDKNSGILVEHNVQGGGTLTFRAKRDGLHFFAIGNFNKYDVTGDFFLDVTSSVYDLSGSAAVCDLSSSASTPCKVQIPLGQPNCAVLASAQGKDPSRPSRDIRVSYAPRFVAYVLLLLSPWLVTILYSYFLKAQSQQAEITAVDSVTPGTPAAPPESMWQGSQPATAVAATSEVVQSADTPGKAPIPASWVPSGTSAPLPMETTPLVAPSAPRLEDDLGGPSLGGAAGTKASKGGSGEAVEDTCSICMEAPKDAVILDCGHRATCLQCGKMLQSGRSPICPICRQPIKHVARVFDA